MALALLVVCDEHDLADLESMYRDLPAEERHATRSGLTVLSLLEPRAQMPDPTPHRARIAPLAALLDRAERRLALAWSYRQRDCSPGVWYRLRRDLVDAAEAWIIDEKDADRLEQSGHAPLPVGRELVPPKPVFFVKDTVLRTAPSRRKVAVRLSSELLQASSLALVPHADTGE